MPLFDELLIKIARNDRLTPLELETFSQEVRSLTEVKTLVKSFIGGDGKILGSYLNLPLELIYSQVLEQDRTAITINVPSIFRNLFVMGSGSVTVASGGNIWAQFNGDTGANYAWQLISADGATLTSSEDTSHTAVALGVFGTTGAGAGVNGSFRSEIIHYTGPWKKNVLSHTYTAEFNDMYLMGSTWANVSPITSIEIFGTDNTLAKGTASLAAGSLFTVYGVQ